MRLVFEGLFGSYEVTSTYYRYAQRPEADFGQRFILYIRHAHESLQDSQSLTFVAAKFYYFPFRVGIQGRRIPVFIHPTKSFLLLH